jgi:hypothetical protein
MAVNGRCLDAAPMIESWPTMDLTLKEHLRRAGRKRWQGKTKAEKSATAQHASRAFWDSLSAEERSRINRERAAKRKKSRR